MNWAVEIKASSLERHNLADLLTALRYQVFDLEEDVIALRSRQLDALPTAPEVWTEAKKVRDAIRGASHIDPDFELGDVVSSPDNEPKRHIFGDLPSAGELVLQGYNPTASIGPPPELSEAEFKRWKDTKAEQEYEAKLEDQLSKLVPVFFEPKAEKVLQLLQEEPDGQTLWKVYETMTGSGKPDQHFNNRFGVTPTEFKRFQDAVHNATVSGDLARHATHERPRSQNPMTIHQAAEFIECIVDKWLSSIRVEKTKERS